MNDDSIWNGLGGLASVVGVVLLVEGLPDTAWFNYAWYAMAYQVSPSKIYYQTKPPDCNFLHAPLGSKECHYKAVVEVFNASGAQIAGDGAPKYSHDIKTNNPIISYDGGKTWDWTTDDSDPKIKRVVVSWIKQTD